MASRLICVSLYTTLVATVLACSAGSDYKSTYKKDTGAGAGFQGSGKNTDTPDHGPTGEDAVASNQPSAPSPSPSSSPSVPSPSPSAPAASKEDAYKAMLAKGKLVSDVMIDSTNLDGASTQSKWFSSANKRIEVLVAVDAAGAPIVPAGVTARQVASGAVGSAPSGQFMANGAAVTTMHSSLRACNNSGGSIYLHSGNGAPFAHGSSAIANGQCAEFLVQRATVMDGASYDHAKGDNPANYVFLKVTKVGPDGKVVP